MGMVSVIRAARTRGSRAPDPAGSIIGKRHRRSNENLLGKRRQGVSSERTEPFFLVYTRKPFPTVQPTDQRRRAAKVHGISIPAVIRE